MSYKNLTAKQIYTGEANYTLDDFVKDFRKKVKEDWGSKRVDKGNKAKKTLYQGIFMLVVFASQRKSVKFISEKVLGKSTKEPSQITKDIIGMYEKEIKVLEGLQMKMFLDNLRKYWVPDFLNLKLLNADFRIWFERALDQKD